MKYPVIHVLSTAGILKHYNQDGLIHEKRTDFTGAKVSENPLLQIFSNVLNDKQLWRNRKHEWIYIFARKGTPVLAATDGFISDIGDRGLGGKQDCRF